MIVLQIDYFLPERLLRVGHALSLDTDSLGVLRYKR